MGKKCFWGQTLNMKRINILVEGQSEENFVSQFLAPILGQKQIFLIARRVETGRKAGKIFRGGVTNYLKFSNDLLNWHKQEPQTLITMMLDYYALPPDFPGYEQAQALVDPYEKVALIETALLNDLESKQAGLARVFTPYIQLHEFEALLFSHPTQLSEELSIYQAAPHLEKQLTDILEAFQANPELINDHPDTAPSKRISRLCPGYNKPILGLSIAEIIGLDHIRSQCRHFNDWLTTLENL